MSFTELRTYRYITGQHKKTKEMSISLCSVFRVVHFFIFFVLSCYVSLCSESRVAHFFSFFVLSCYVSVCSEFRVAHFFSFFVLSCYVSVCSEFRVTHFFSFFFSCPDMYLYVLCSVLLIS
jgi:hypothetical protein